MDSADSLLLLTGKEQSAEILLAEREKSVVLLLVGERKFAEFWLVLQKTAGLLLVGIEGLVDFHQNENLTKWATNNAQFLVLK